MSDDFTNYISDQLSLVEPFVAKKMFGGVGYFKDSLMFALIAKGVFHLKVDDSNRQEYLEHGMKNYLASEKKKGMPYYEVPQEILEDREALSSWARKSIKIANKKSKK